MSTGKTKEISFRLLRKKSRKKRKKIRQGKIWGTAFVFSLWQMSGQFQHVLSLCGTCTQTTLPTLHWPAGTPHLHLYWIGVQSHIFFKMWNTRDNSYASPLNIACYNCLDQCLWSPFVSTWKANKISKPLVLATTHLFAFFFLSLLHCPYVHVPLDIVGSLTIHIYIQWYEKIVSLLRF